MSLSRLLRRPGLRGISLGLGCAVLAWLAAHSALLSNLEEWLQDGCFTFRGKRHRPTNVLLVGLDDKSLDALKKPLLYTSPELAEVVVFFKDKGALAIGVDMMIPEIYAGLPELQEGQPGDATRLGQAIQDAGNVVLPAWDTPDRSWRPVVQWQLKHRLDPGPADFGFVNLTEDNDFFVRRQILGRADGAGDPHFALALAATARRAKIEWTDGSLFLQGSRVPLDDEQKLRINFVGPPGTFKVVPLIDVLAAARGERGLPAVADPRGAIVIIGTTARTQQDYHITPYSNTYSASWNNGPSELMSGSEIHANIVATLLDRAYIVVPPMPVQLTILLAVGGMLGWVYARLRLGGGLVVAVAHHFAWKFLSLALFSSISVRLEVLPALVLGGLLYGVTFLKKWWTLRRMARSIKGDAVLAAWEADPGSLETQDRVITVLFADIRDFSIFSENHAAHDVVALLNAYFTAVVPVVERHGGTLNQYVGDGMMVLFGSPGVQHDHAARAVRAAQEMVSLVRAMQKEWARLDFSDLRIGVGINTGRAAIGVVGSPNRLDYTAIGHTTNMASRIEAATKDEGKDILISRSTYLEVQRLGLGCDPESRQVRVKQQTVEVHAVGTGSSS